MPVEVTPNADNVSKTAFNEVFQYLMSFRADDLLPQNIDAKIVGDTAVEVSARIQYLREKVSKAGYFDMTNFDQLGNFGRALNHVISQIAAPNTDKLEELMNEAKAQNEGFKNDIASLVFHKTLAPNEVPPIAASKSYRAAAIELRARANFLQDHWKGIVNRSALQWQDTVDALTLCDKIDQAMGVKGVGLLLSHEDVHVSPAELLQRAFTACVRAYNQNRRVILYVRDNEEAADRLIPSLYVVGRNVRKSSARQSGATSPTTTTTTGSAHLDVALPVSPEPVPGGPGGNPFTSE